MQAGQKSSFPFERHKKQKFKARLAQVTEDPHCCLGDYPKKNKQTHLCCGIQGGGADADLSFCPEAPMPVAAGQQPGAWNELKGSFPIV